jgi:hypothetical protein
MGARVLPVIARSEATKQSSGQRRTCFAGRHSLRCRTGLRRFARNDEKEREAERRQTHFVFHATAPHGRMLPPARASGAARLSAFHRGSCLGDPTPPLSSRYALPGTRSERTIPMVRKTVRLSRGRYPRLPVPVQRIPRRPVIMPAGRMPGAAPAQVASPRGSAAPAPPSKVPSRRRPSMSVIRYLYPYR